MSKLRECQVCGEPIHRRTNAAYSNQDDMPPDVAVHYPWLHLYGLRYLERGYDLHDAVPMKEPA